MEQLGYQQNEPTPIAQDNMDCIYLTQGTRMYHKAKYIDTRVYKVREVSSRERPEVKLWKIDGSDQPSDYSLKRFPGFRLSATGAQSRSGKKSFDEVLNGGNLEYLAPLVSGSS